MTIAEFKQSILDRTVADNFVILLWEDNNFIANQYIDAICKNNCIEANNINSIYNTLDRSALSLVFDTSLKLNIIRVDCFDEVAEDYSEFKNTIVICKSVDKKIYDQVEDFIIQIPKLVDWQIQDYIKVCCPSITEDDVADLMQITGNNIYKIDSELSKLMLFPGEEHSIIAELKYNKYSSMVEYPVTDLTNAITNEDINKVIECLKFRRNCDFEPTGVVTMLLNKYKQVVFANPAFGSGVTAAQLGIQERAFKGIGYYNRHLSLEKLRRNIKFLSAFDRKLKLGLIDLSKEEQLDYILCNIL